MKIKCILFDVDWVIITSERFSSQLWFNTYLYNWFEDFNKYFLNL